MFCLVLHFIQSRLVREKEITLSQCAQQHHLSYNQQVLKGFLCDQFDRNLKNYISTIQQHFIDNNRTNLFTRESSCRFCRFLSSIENKENVTSI